MKNYFLAAIALLLIGLGLTYELELANKKLADLSVRDGLTGIANRRHFDQELAREHARHIRSGQPLSLILLDIAHFKAFNDSYGHVKGDECLRQVGQAIADALDRPADLAARYGGEEFACILSETDSCAAIALAERIRHRIQSLAIAYKASTEADCITASLGVVTVNCHAGESGEALLIKADELLYEAKSSGRNRIKYVSDDFSAGT